LNNISDISLLTSIKPVEISMSNCGI
jgi:hypothetical protein